MKSQINPNQLIRGAYLEYRGKTLKVYPDPYDPDKVLCLGSLVKWIDIPDLSPIPITPERLERLGFEEKDTTGLDYELFIKGEIEVTIYGGLISARHILGSAAKVQYVHLLQLLVSFFTGELLQYTTKTEKV